MLYNLQCMTTFRSILRLRIVHSCSCMPRYLIIAPSIHQFLQLCPLYPSSIHSLLHKTSSFGQPSLLSAISCPVRDCMYACVSWRACLRECVRECVVCVSVRECVYGRAYVCVCMCVCVCACVIA